MSQASQELAPQATHTTLPYAGLQLGLLLLSSLDGRLVHHRVSLWHDKLKMGEKQTTRKLKQNNSNVVSSVLTSFSVLLKAISVS